MGDFGVRGFFPVLVLVGAVCCSDTWQQFPWGIVKATPRPQTLPPPGPPFDSHLRVSEGQGVSPVQSVRVQCGEDKLLLRVQLDLFGTRHLVKAADLTLGTAGCRPTRIYSQNHTVLFDYGLHECGSRLQGMSILKLCL